MALVGLTLCLVLWLTTGCRGQDVFLERPASQRVDLNAPAQLNCTANDSEATLQWWRRGSVVTTTGSGRVRVEQGAVTIAAADWADIGVYTCTITFRGETYSASANFNITGYMVPYVNAVPGTSTMSHVTGEEGVVECPIAGTPGPHIFYWQNTSSLENVTNDENVGSGVFVDEQGRLDLSRAQPKDSQLFACVGVDVAGNSARTLVRVNVVDPVEDEEEEELNPVEWYFILAYCVAGALVLAGVAVVVFVCWLSHDQCCERITKKKPVRIRVRRSKVTLDDVEVEA